MLLSTNPFEILNRLEDELKDLPQSLGRSQSLVYKPSAEVVVDGEDALLTFDIPGVDVANDLEVTLEDGRLKVKGERKGMSDPEDTRGSEIWYGTFIRELSVPSHLTAEDIEASYDRGQLKLRLKNATPKKEEPVRIEVMTAESEPKKLEGGTSS